MRMAQHKMAIQGSEQTLEIKDVPEMKLGILLDCNKSLELVKMTQNGVRRRIFLKY